MHSLVLPACTQTASPLPAPRLLCRTKALAFTTLPQNSPVQYLFTLAHHFLIWRMLRSNHIRNFSLIFIWEECPTPKTGLLLSCCLKEPYANDLVTPFALTARKPRCQVLYPSISPISLHWFFSLPRSLSYFSQVYYDCLFLVTFLKSF